MEIQYRKKVDVVKALELYEQGQTLEEISKVFNVSRKTLDNRFREFNIRFKGLDISPTLKFNIYKLYMGGKTRNEISLDLHISASSVCRVLRGYGQQRVRCPSATKNEKLEIGKLYVEGLQYNEIAKQLNLSISIVGDVVRKSDQIQIRPVGYALRGKRSSGCLAIDGDIFKRRDSETAYYCGLLYADGHVRVSSNTVSLGLVDKEVVEGFTKFLGLPIERMKVAPQPAPWKTSYTTTVTHINFKPDLQLWGLVPRKTYNFVEPNVPLEILPDFLRGWFDGDGSISFAKKQTKKYGEKRSAVFRITGNYASLAWYAESLRKLGYVGHIGITAGHSDVYGHLQIGGNNQVSDVCNLIQGPTNMFRKWDQIKEAQLI